MTIVFTAAFEDIIVMVADSAVTYDFDNGKREYDKRTKSFPIPGVGCITTWGDQDHNHVGSFLDGKRIGSDSHSIQDVAFLVKEYLMKEYRPHELRCEVGFHVAGFNWPGHARLFHIFYGFDRPRPPEQKEMEYKYYLRSLAPGQVELLYNGRDDLAWVVVDTLLDQLHAGGALHTRFAGKLGLVALGDLVARFAAEITPEVGPPFVTQIVNQENEIAVLRNDSLCPLEESQIRASLEQLDYQV
jgi:hypothetical protein